MCALSAVSPPNDVVMQPLIYDCAACGVSGPAAIVAYPYGGGVLTLCSACARDRAHLRELVRALGPWAVRAAIAPLDAPAA